MRRTFHAFVAAGFLLLAPRALAADDLDEMLEAARARHDIPAIAALVLKDGEIVAEGAVGERAMGSGVRVTRDDLWHLGSNTKAMTAFLAARLIDKGLLDWRTTLHDVLGESVPDMRDVYEPVTLDDLFSHQSGLPANLPALPILMFKADDRPLSLQRLAYAQAALIDAPRGERGRYFEYSNSGFVVAAAMLETAADSDYETLMQREIFAPLGITHFGWGPPGTDGTLDQPIAHAGAIPVTARVASDNPAVLSGAGTLHLSLRDWAKFADAMLDAMGGDTSLVSADALLHLTTPQHDGSTYAGGWVLVTALGDGVIAHEGSNTVWYAIIALSPHTNTAILLVSNSGAARDAEVEVLQQILATYPL